MLSRLIWGAFGGRGSISKTSSAAALGREGPPDAADKDSAHKGHSGVRPEKVMTNSISSISSSLKRFLVNTSFSRDNSQSPTGFFPIIAIQLPALPLRVLMMPSTEEAPPPIGPSVLFSEKRSEER